MTPMEFVKRIAKMQTFEEQMRVAALDDHVPKVEVQAYVEAAQKDMNWLINDSADLEDLIRDARKIVEANPEE